MRGPATEAFLGSAPIDPFDVSHLATHGLVDERTAARGPDQPGAGEAWRWRVTAGGRRRPVGMRALDAVLTPRLIRAGCRSARRAALVALVLLAGCAGGGRGATSLAAVPPPAADAAMQVLVSRREMLIRFPRDTATAWGWLASDANGYAPRYDWGVVIDAPDEPVSLDLMVYGELGEARRFGSFAQLVRTGDAVRCHGGMVRVCTEWGGLRARLDHGRPTLLLRDSARIDSLFGMRPAWVARFRRTPAGFERDSVRITYLEPQIPQPTVATAAAAARRRRVHDVSASSISRSIVSAGDWHADLWLATGDVLPVTVLEQRCREDVCTIEFGAASDSGWMVRDSTVVAIRSDTARILYPSGRRRPPGPRLVALRPGRTTLHVRGLHGAADTMPSRTPVPRELTREIVVTPPIARVEIGPHADTVRAGESFAITIRVTDIEGRVYDEAPVSIRSVEPPASGGLSTGRVRQFALYGPPGRRTIVATFGGRADTTTVELLPRHTP